MTERIRVETVESLAGRLGLTPDAVIEEVLQGRLPYVNVAGHWRFREKDIEYWLRCRRRTEGLRLVSGGEGGE